MAHPGLAITREYSTDGSEIADRVSVTDQRSFECEWHVTVQCLRGLLLLAKGVGDAIGEDIGVQPLEQPTAYLVRREIMGE